MSTAFFARTALARRLVASTALLVCMLATAARPARADDVVPTTPLTVADGSTVGFATNEPSLYFLMVSQWALMDGGHTPPARLTDAPPAPDGSPRYDLRLVLTPDYRRAAPAVVALRGQDPRALFFPLPSSIQRVTLFIPGALGGIEAELVPDEDGLATPVALYYRLRFDALQLAVLRQLAQSGLALQGSVEYLYAAPDGIQDTAAPLTVLLDRAELEVSTAPPPDPTAWLADLLATTRLSIRGPLDGPYSLGSGISVQLVNSRVEGALLPGTWALAANGTGTISLVPTARPDLAGRIAFDVPALGAQIRVDYRAAMAASLDLNFMQLDLTSFEVTQVTVNGAPSPFYTALLRNLMATPAVRTRVSQALSDELQRRILSQTLFGLGDILP
jgi:hypothetical protein